MNSIFQYKPFIFLSLLLLLSACTGTGAPVQAPVSQAVDVPPVAVSEQPTSAPPEPTALPTAVPSPESLPSPTAAVADKPLLEWEGYSEFGDGDASKCKVMQIGADHATEVGYCKSSLEKKGTIRQQMVLEMFARLAPFEFKTDKDHLIFRGQGKEADPIWQQAVLEWVHTTYGEISTGHVCASCSTVFTWSMGVVPSLVNTCKLVYVLAWGYANVGTFPCTGGNSQDLRSGWLTTEEWKTLRELTGNFAINPDVPNTDTSSRVPGNDELTDKLNGWSRGIYDRLSQP